MSRRLLCAVLSSSLLGGCAFSLRGPDPDQPRNEEPNCDTEKTLVVIDGLVATAMGIATLSLVDQPEPAVALLPLSIGALYVAGAISGNSAVNKCRIAKGNYESGRVPIPDVASAPEPAREAYQQPPGEVAGPVSPAPPSQPPPSQPPPVAPRTAPPVEPPRSAPAAPPSQAAPGPAPTRGRPAPARTDEDDDDAWSAFWKEVP